MINLIQHHYGSEAKISCLDKGFVRLVDVMPGNVDNEDIPTGDFAIVQSARVSYGKGTKKINEDRGLIRYLMRHKHTSPFEQAELKFHIKMPIFVARQWVRHRTASLNEYSGRYSEMKDEFYMPEIDRLQAQSKTNKQGSGEELPTMVKENIISYMLGEQFDAYEIYKQYLDSGLSKELARINLPLSNYTEMYWKSDLLNLMKLLVLRIDSHAQYEIRVFADAIYKLIEPLFPLTIEAFNDYWVNGSEFSKQELDLIKSIFAETNISDETIKGFIEETTIDMSKREKLELINKLGI